MVEASCNFRFRVGSLSWRHLVRRMCAVVARSGGGQIAASSALTKRVVVRQIEGLREIGG